MINKEYALIVKIRDIKFENWRKLSKFTYYKQAKEFIFVGDGKECEEIINKVKEYLSSPEVLEVHEADTYRYSMKKNFQVDI